jgi:hypothetical protein
MGGLAQFHVGWRNCPMVPPHDAAIASLVAEADRVERLDDSPIRVPDLHRDADTTVGCGHFALADLADAHKFSLIFNSASRSVI